MKEDKVIQDWLEKELPTEEKAQMEKFIAFTEKLSIPESKSKAEAWNSLLSKIEESSTDNSRIIDQSGSSSKNLWVWLASTAAVFFLAYFTFFQNSTITTHESAPGETFTFNLPDIDAVAKTVLFADVKIRLSYPGVVEVTSQ